MTTPTVIPLPHLPRRKRDAHKGDFGRAYLLCGSVGYTGAPVLAAGGCLKSGAGLVFVGTPAGAYPTVAGKLLCAMAEPLAQREGGLAGANLPHLRRKLAGMDAVLIGPRLGRHEESDALARALTREVTAPLVLDADGINALGGHIDALDARRDRVTILTPHMGEFQRLLGRETRFGREEEAAAFAAGHGCVLVLKGQNTLVALPDGTLYQNPTGNPGMASGGSGDVLAGMITGFLAQGFSAGEAACFGVYLHGLAGDLAAGELGEYAMTAGDIFAYLPAAMKRAEEGPGAAETQTL